MVTSEGEFTDGALWHGQTRAVPQRRLGPRHGHAHCLGSLVCRVLVQREAVHARFGQAVPLPKRHLLGSESRPQGRRAGGATGDRKAHTTQVCRVESR